MNLSITTPPDIPPTLDLTPGAFFFGCLLAVILGVIVLIITAIRGNRRR
jgi:hypothetical protein